MVRFNPNRSWAFVLTLCLFTVCFFLCTVPSPPAANAGLGSYYYTGTGDPSGDPPALGDPDVPAGPGDGKCGKGGVIRSGSNQAVSQNGARPVGEGVPSTNVVMDRVRLFLLGLRSLFLRL